MDDIYKTETMIKKIAKEAQKLKEKSSLRCEAKTSHIITTGDVRCVILAIEMANQPLELTAKGSTGQLNR